MKRGGRRRFYTIADLDVHTRYPIHLAEPNGDGAGTDAGGAAPRGTSGAVGAESH